MIDNYQPLPGTYVRHKFDEAIKGIVECYDESGTQCYLTLHSGQKAFMVFTGNIEDDTETYREHKIKDLLCQEK